MVRPVVSCWRGVGLGSCAGEGAVDAPSSTGEREEAVPRVKDEYKVQLVDADLPEDTYDHEQSELTGYDDSLQDYIHDADGGNYHLDDPSGNQSDSVASGLY